MFLKIKKQRLLLKGRGRCEGGGIAGGMLDELQLFSELGVGDWIQAEDWNEEEEEEEGACRRGREGESCFMFELTFSSVPQRGSLQNAAFRNDSAENCHTVFVSDVGGDVEEPPLGLGGCVGQRVEEARWSH